VESFIVSARKSRASVAQATLPFALTLGIAAGYFRGWVDDVIQYVYTTISSIPSVLLIAASVEHF